MPEQEERNEPQQQTQNKAKKIVNRRQTIATEQLKRPTFNNFLAGLQQNHEAQTAPVQIASTSSRRTFFSRGRRPLTSQSDSTHFSSESDELASPLIWFDDDAPDAPDAPLVWTDADEPASPFAEAPITGSCLFKKCQF